MILSEYVTNKNRKVFKGSHQKNEKQNSCLYVTYNILYAFQYSGENGYIEQYNLKKGINLFNPRFKKDWEKYKKYCLENNLSKFLVPLDSLANDDWLDIWNWTEREQFIQIIKNLGYEGFVNYEGDYNFVKVCGKEWNERYNRSKYTFSGVGIFNTSFVEKEIIYKGYSEFLKIPAFQEEYEFEKDQLIKEIYKYCKRYNCKDPKAIENEIDYDKYVILKQDEVFHILDTFDYSKVDKELKLIEKRRRYITRQRLALHYGIPLDEVEEDDITSFMKRFYRV